MDGTSFSSNDLLEAVRESAMLADVTIGTWNAEKTDKKTSEKVKQDAGAVGHVGRYVKYLLPGADRKYKAAKSAFAAVRQLHYDMTLPWVADPHASVQRGARLLPNLLFQDYVKRMSAAKREATTRLAEFLSEYDAAVREAKTNLGALADADYPDATEVERAFKVSFDFTPVPQGAQFKGLPQTTVDRLSAGLEARQQRMLESAQQAMWEEVRTRVGHLCERLRDPENKFHASTVENVRELLTLLPGWNLTGNPQVTEAVRDIRDMLDGIDSDTLRKQPAERSAVANKADQLARKLAAWNV